jgi:hypothetical protein
MAENGEILNTVMSEELDDNMVDADATGGNIGDILDRSTEPWTITPRPAPQPSVEEYNAPILAALADIDARSIRPLRAGDKAALAELEKQAQDLRAQLR